MVLPLFLLGVVPGDNGSLPPLLSDSPLANASATSEAGVGVGEQLEQLIATIVLIHAFIDDSKYRGCGAVKLSLFYHDFAANRDKRTRQWVVGGSA